MKQVNLFIIIALITSCSLEKIEPIELEGTWYKSDGYNQDIGGIYQTELIFDINGNFKRTLQVKDSTTDKLLGFVFMEKAAYSLEGTRLKRYDAKLYGLNDTDLFLPEDELVFISKRDEYQDVLVSVDNTKDTLTFDYSLIDCPYNAICIDKEMFIRKKVSLTAH